MIPLLLLVGLSTDPAHAAAPTGDPERGAVWAELGSCGACHTAEEGPPYAGGHAIETDRGDPVEVEELHGHTDQSIPSLLRDRGQCEEVEDAATAFVRHGSTTLEGG